MEIKVSFVSRKINFVGTYFQRNLFSRKMIGFSMSGSILQIISEVIF